jgi:hypothetical protein
MEMLLDKQELLDLGKELHGVKVVCREGCCWITLSCDNRDHILKHGDSFIVRGRGHVIVTAMDSCRLLLTDSQPEGRLDQPFTALCGLLRSCTANSFDTTLS